MLNGEQLKEKLIELQGKIETIETLQREKGENFNVFSILDMERLEVKTHSSFIYELLNPEGSHAQGKMYLKLFIKNVLKISEFNYTNMQVERENYFPDEGRIDFTIENDETFIAIEMKIDAPDQKEQMKRYFETAERKTSNPEVYFLTLNGKNASDQSTGLVENDTNSKIKYTNLSFSDDILSWIEMCVEKSASLPIIRESLVQYANLVKKITGKTSEEITMEVIEMIDNPKIAKSATKMAQNLGLVWATREAVFWDNLLNHLEPELEKIGWNSEEEDLFLKDDERKDIEDISDTIYKYRKNKNATIEFMFNKKINKTDIEFILYQFNSQDKLFYQLNEIENISYNEFDTLAKKLDLSRKNKKNQYGPSKITVNFYGKDVVEPTYDLFDDEKLKKLVEAAAKDVLDKLRIINRFFNKDQGQ